MTASVAGGGRVQVIHLTNKSASPANKKYHVRLGWRPEAVFVSRLLDGAASAASTGWKFDNSTYADGAGEIVNTNGDQDETGSVLEIKDYGLEIGTATTFFRAASAEVVLVAFQSERGMLEADLGDDEVGTFKARFGTGDQFDFDEDAEDNLDWLFVAA